MKSIWIVTHNLHGGGCERVISILANRFAAMNLAVTILPEYTSDCFYAFDPRVSIRPLSGNAAMRAKDVPGVYARLRGLVQSERPDVILAMPDKVNVWTVLSLIGTGVPVIVSERNDPARYPKSKIKRMLRKLVYPFAAGFIFQTERQAMYFPGRIRSRGIVLDNPFETEGLPEPYAGVREKRAVSAGRLAPQKNFPLLIDAFAQFYQTHPDWSLVIYGEGAERTALEERVKALGIASAVRLPGQIKNLSAETGNAGMFVLSSDYEGMPNALIEAMAQGLCCVSTDCPAGGPQALIRHGENGLLTPVGDAGALASAMERLADDDALSAELSKNAALVRERFTASRVAEQWRNYLERIADKTNR